MTFQKKVDFINSNVNARDFTLSVKFTVFNHNCLLKSKKVVIIKGQTSSILAIVICLLNTKEVYHQNQVSFCLFVYRVTLSPGNYKNSDLFAEYN